MEDVASTSPDGKWTAFATDQRGNWDIAIRSNETGEIRFLTSSSANDLTPSFSPDGRSVYFASDRHRGYRFTTIYRVSIDGQGTDSAHRRPPPLRAHSLRMRL